MLLLNLGDMPDVICVLLLYLAGCLLLCVSHCAVLPHQVESSVECDTFFPQVDSSRFRLWSASEPTTEGRGGADSCPRYSFLCYTAVAGASTSGATATAPASTLAKLPPAVASRHEEYQVCGTHHSTRSRLTSVSWVDTRHIKWAQDTLGGLRCWVWATGCGLLGVGCWVWATGCGLLGGGYWVWAAGCGLLGGVCWVWAAGRGLLGVGCWVWAAGYGLLGVGYLGSRVLDPTRVQGS